MTSWTGGPSRRIVTFQVAEPRPGLRRRAATFDPDPAAVAAYDERYANWREVYQRMLDITDDGLLRPLWRAAGA